MTDEQARKLITTDIAHNYFVEAGAGSGKTTSLVERMTNMVLGGIPVDKICAITFTKAAANEFYERFYAKLSKISADDKTPTGKKQLADKAIANIDLCFLGTMDSFVSTIIKEHPVLAGVPSDCAIVKDADQKRELYAAEYARMMRGEYGPDIQIKHARFKRYFYNHEDVFLDLMCDVISENHDAEFERPEPDPRTFEKMLGGYRRLFVELINVAGDHLYGGTRPAEAYEKLTEMLPTVNKNWDWVVAHDKKTLQAFVGKMSSLVLADDLQGKFADILEATFVKKINANKYSVRKSLVQDINAQITNQLYAIALDFTLDFSSVVFERLRAQGNLTFFDYKLYVRDMLARDAAGDGRLIRHISQRHYYYLLDEFQDTAPIQAEIFFYLACDFEKTQLTEASADNWMKCYPRAGSLFIVGDPKQSIYRFQNADVESFNRVKRLFDGERGQVLELTRNFRSSREMCEYFNSTFPDLIAEDYAPIPCEDNYSSEGAFGGVFEYEILAEKAAAARAEDAERVCKIISQLVDNEDMKIMKRCSSGEKDEQGRPKYAPQKVEYSDIMVVSKNKAPLENLLNRMKDYGIPAKTNGFVPFNTCAVLQECAKIFYAIENPADEIAAYLALSGEYFQLSKQQIFELKIEFASLSIGRLRDVSADSCDDKARIENKNNAGNLSPQQLTETPSNPLQVLASLRDECKNLPIIATINKIVESLGLMRKLGTDNLEFFYYAIERLRGAIVDGSITSKPQAAQMLLDISSNISDDERCLSLSDDNNAVSVANLHKVKGLEAPIVILATPNTSLYRAKTTHSFKITNTEKKGYIFSSTGIKTALYDEQKDEESQLLQNETLRLLYVAATRARVALIVGRYSDDDESFTKSTWNKLLVWANPLPECDTVTNNLTQQVEHNFPHDLKKSELVLTFGKNEPTYNKINPSKLDKDCVKNFDSSDVPAGAKLPHFNDYIAGSFTPVDTSYEADLSENFSSESDSDRLPAIINNKCGSLTLTDADEKGQTSREESLLLGTLVHRALEILMFSVGGNNSFKNTSANAKDIAKFVIGEAGVNADQGQDTSTQKLEKILINVVTTMQNDGFAQSNGSPQNLLAEIKQSKQHFQEVPFTYMQGSALITGIIDLLYQDSSGSWHIIDYKTNADASNLDKHYAEQLRTYIAAAQQIININADAKIYHISI